MILNAISACGTLWAAGTGLRDIHISINKTNKAKAEQINKSDDEFIHENFKKILNHTNTNTNTNNNITISNNAEKFVLYCKALGITDNLEVKDNKITLDTNKIRTIQTALTNFDESVRNGDTNKLFDVDIDNADYISRTLGDKALNFIKNPLGKPEELFYRLKNKNNSDNANKQPDELKPDELKNDRIANNVFILLQEQEKKCIKEFDSATADTPFEYKDSTTRELIKNAKYFGNDGKSQLTNAAINQKMKQIYDSKIVLDVENPEMLDTLMNEQKLSLGYNVFFKEGVKLTDTQKEYIKKNAKFITVTVSNNEELLNLTKKMNELSATDSEVIHNETTAKLNNTSALFDLLATKNEDPQNTISEKTTPIDYIKKAVFLHHLKEDNTADKQNLFKQIITHKQFDAIEKSFPNFMAKIFPNDLKRYNDWDKNYLTDTDLSNVFEKLSKEPMNDDAKIKDFSQQAQTDIVKKFLKSGNFNDKNGEEQFKIIKNIKAKFNNISGIKTLCENKLTQDKILQHIFDTATKGNTQTQGQAQGQAKKLKALIKDFAPQTQSKIIENFLNQAKAQTPQNLLVIKDEFANIPNIKNIIARVATKNKIKLNNTFSDYYSESTSNALGLTRNTPKSGLLNFTGKALNENSDATAILGYIIDARFNKLSSKETENDKNITIANAFVKKMLGDKNDTYLGMSGISLDELLNRVALEKTPIIPVKQQQPEKDPKEKKGWFGRRKAAPAA